MARLRHCTCAGLAAALLLGPAAQAADHALLVGVGDYETISDLPGIEIDIDMMRDLAPLMGFAEIDVLRDSEATHANVRAALERLARSLEEGDRALFYFSGHGAQFKDANGDEDDGKDEGLLLHDSDWNGQEAKNVLLDDELGAVLAQARNGELLVLVDACNSGTVDKQVRGLGRVEASAFSEAQQVVTKGKGYIEVSVKATGAVSRDDPQARYVMLTAAQDHEFAQASQQGSYFTLGLREAMVAAAGQGEITPLELRERAKAFIEENVRPAARRFTPQLRGDQALFDKPIRLVSVGRHGQLWQRFEELFERSGKSGMSISTDLGERIDIGEFYSLTIDMPVAGYLSVVAVDSGSEDPVVLFPNPWIGETRFPPGKVVLPPADDMAWGLKALPPTTKTLIMAIVTPEPLNLYAKGIRQDRVDSWAKAFARLAPSGVYALEKNQRATAAVGRQAAARVVVDFVE